jgi:hypothetical protein
LVENLLAKGTDTNISNGSIHQYILIKYCLPQSSVTNAYTSNGDHTTCDLYHRYEMGDKELLNGVSNHGL